jgi:NAD kinase
MTDTGVFSFLMNYTQTPLTPSQILLNYQSQYSILPLNLIQLAVFLTNNFTHTFVSFNNLMIQSGANIQGSRIAIYGNNLQILGVVNSTAMGC